MQGSFHVSKWHPWKDRSTVTAIPAYWRDSSILGMHDAPLFDASSIKGLLDAVASNKLFLFCPEILDPSVIDVEELLTSPNVDPFISRNGGISALRVSCERKTGGYIVNQDVWNWSKEASSDLLRSIEKLWGRFGFSALTPASLSEKVLRSTLPTPVKISRPSVILRRDILDNHGGGRIDLKDEPEYFPEIWEYDKNKAYLYHSSYVPSPYRSPVTRLRPSLDEAMNYPAGWWKVQMVARKRDISPIQIEGRTPEDGECVEKWMWSGEILDCIKAGYTILSIERGYGFREMSDWMGKWSDILWSHYEQAKNEDEHTLSVIKSMMVGLPGRFLRRPETFKLIPLEQAIPNSSDFPLLLSRRGKHGNFISDFAVRTIEDRESTALTPVGAYIVSEMRRELYHMMLAEEQAGNRIIRSYIDCYATDKPTRLKGTLGTGLGQWKEKRYTDVWAMGNRFVGQRDGIGEMRAPGLAKHARLSFWQNYKRMMTEMRKVS